MRLRVVLATVHIPLAEVPRAPDAGIARGDHRADRARAAAVRMFRRRASPSPASIRTRASTACSAGRRTQVIRPGDRRVPRERHRRRRPVSRPTPFSCAPSRGEFDVVVACYHDQGLIPVKLLAFGQAVNVTLGLPIVRTSVDHGTAFDIAGQGVADPAV